MKNIVICDDVIEICMQIKSYIEEFCKEYQENFHIDIVNNAKRLYGLLEEKDVNLLFFDIFDKYG